MVFSGVAQVRETGEESRGPFVDVDLGCSECMLRRYSMRRSGPRRTGRQDVLRCISVGGLPLSQSEPTGERWAVLQPHGLSAIGAATLLDLKGALAQMHQ